MFNKITKEEKIELWIGRNNFTGTIEEAEKEIERRRESIRNTPIRRKRSNKIK